MHALGARAQGSIGQTNDQLLRPSSFTRNCWFRKSDETDSYVHFFHEHMMNKKEPAMVAAIA
jgi:hypothetical protein